MSSTKQGAIVSSKTSSSKSSVKGKTIVDSLGGMSKVGLELENFVDPELTWKSVTKGYRTSSRRARRHALRNFVAGEKLSVQGSRKVEEGTASDTEKHGVAILGRRFSDKRGDIPLKKRRVMLRSPSPSPRSRQEASELGSLIEKFSKAGEDSATVDTRQRSEDFSGLEILAAVIASNNVTGQVDNGHSRSVVQSSRDRICSLPKGNAFEGKGKGPSLLDQTGAVLPKSPIKKEIGFGEGSGSVKDTRLLWDLNVPADAWGHSSHSCTIGGRVNASTCLLSGTEEMVEVLNNSEVNSECKNSDVDRVSEDAKEPLSVSADRKDSSPGIHEAINRQDVFDSSADLDRDSEGRVCSVVATKNSCKIAGAISSLDHLDHTTISADDRNDCPKIKEGIEALSSDGTPAKVLSMGDGSDDSYGSDVYQTEKVGLNSAGRDDELLDGYDSQFEDGELREPDARYYCDENGGEDGEVEQVDYGSECDEGLLGVKEVEAERLSTPGSCQATRKTELANEEMGTAREDSASTKSSEKDVPSGLVGTRGNQSPSFPEDAKWRKSSYSRSENCGKLFPRDETNVRPKRFFGRDRQFADMRGRSPGRSSTAYWNLERRCSPNRSADTYDRPRPKGLVEGRRYMMASDRMDSQAQRFVGFENRAGRQFMNSREHIMRRRSPGFRGEDSYGTNSRMFPLREMSPQARNQFRRFTNSRSSSIRDEEFRNSFPEDATNHYSGCNRLSKRDRSMSPPPRGFPQYLMPRSRSRIRSPPNYLQQREQRDADGSLMRSRSPGLNRGVRIPFQKRFTARYEDQDQFASPPMRRQFPPSHIRSFDDRCGGGSDEFRGTKLPVRMYRRQQGNNRFDPIRGNNNDEFRPPMQQRGYFRDAASSDSRRRFEMSRNNAAEEEVLPIRRLRCSLEGSVAANDANKFDEGSSVDAAAPTTVSSHA